MGESGQVKINNVATVTGPDNSVTSVSLILPTHRRLRNIIIDVTVYFIKGSHSYRRPNP
jgi:hypothetical protein